jgi:hypothetical protein
LVDAAQRNPKKRGHTRSGWRKGMYEYLNLSLKEKVCVALSFIGAGLAGFGALKLGGMVEHHLRTDTELPAVAAIAAFFSTLTLMLKGVDEMKGQRLRDLVKRAETHS